MNDEDELFNAADALIDVQEFGQALALLLNHNNQDDIDVMLMIAFCQYNLEMYADAVDQFDKIEKTYGQLENSTFLRANCHLELGNYQLARHDYEAVLKLKPGTYDAYVGLGVVSESEGNTGEAKRYYRDALALNPDSVVARKRLAAIKDT